MKIHPDKTKCVIISTCQKLKTSPTQTLDLSLDGSNLKQVNSEKVLGVHIDSHLTWTIHIDEL